jgi:DNA-binding helix-hairpin-helix protein with protein kinase domain
MDQMLPNGITINCINLSSPLQVNRLLGAGGQGEVYEVNFSGETLAAKWYFPKTVKIDNGLNERLRDSIRSSSPSPSFLWPISLLEPTESSCMDLNIPEGSFGYLMALRPPGFVGAIEHSAARIAISIRSVVRACFQLADAFDALHSNGLCYKDISQGNIFLRPENGDILICDNDNVEVNGRNRGLAVGTPGFMAPEVLLGKSMPSAESDLFSLAVLMFHLLTRSDPLKGAMEMNIRCLDEPAKRRLYGEEPVFIFDPEDDRNRPDPDVHKAAVLTWPIYPKRLQQLFEKTFGPGMRNPSARVRTGQWCEALVACLDSRLICHHCGQEAFATAGQVSRCWACGASIEPPAWLTAGHGVVLAQPENELYPHHFNQTTTERIDAPVGRLQAHPSDPRILGLENLSSQGWSATYSNGQSMVVPPGRSCNLNHLNKITTHLGVVALMR